MNRILLILGASSEVGIELIKKIHTNYDIIIAHYNSSVGNLNIIKKEIGEKLHLQKADFTSVNETNRFIDEIKNEYIYVTDIVHLPADNVRSIHFHKSDWDFIERDIDISLRSIYKITQYFIRNMAKEKKGKIILLLSSTVVSPTRFMLDYTTIKYALLGFMKSLSIEYADKSICINAISPSMIETKFLKNLPRFIVEQSAEKNPQKRNAAINDIIPMIEFLLSDEANFITGQNIVISGGSEFGY